MVTNKTDAVLFIDLQITGEFDNRPGTGRFLRIFSCVVTYRTGAGRRLYMITSADTRPATVRHRMMPGQRCKPSTTYGTFFTCNHVYTNIKIRHHSSKETCC